MNPSQLLIGNGSDELLQVIVRTFVEPGQAVAVLEPSYSFYHTIATINGAHVIGVNTDPQFDLSEPVGRSEARVLFLASPNPPAGNRLCPELVEETCARSKCVTVIDEAYVDFAESDSLYLVNEYPNVIITRSMSKSYSLAGLRIGIAITSDFLVNQMCKVQGSYSVDRLAQAAATAAFKEADYFKGIWKRIRHTKDVLTESLMDLDFTVLRSDANFVLAKPHWIKAVDLYAELRQRRILVRHFNAPRVCEYLRITVGTDDETARLIETTGAIREAVHARSGSPDHRSGQ